MRSATGGRCSSFATRSMGCGRFGEFQKNLGLAKNILSARLRNLVDHGILETVPASDGSAYHEYALTEKGLGLFPCW